MQHRSSSVKEQKITEFKGEEEKDDRDAGEGAFDQGI